MKRAPFTVVAALAVAALVAGCSSGSEELSAEAQWADGICTARADLSQSVGELNDSLTFTPGSGTALEDAKTQVADRLDAVKTSAAGLKSAIDDVPADTQSEITATQQQLSNDIAGIELSLNAVGTAAQSAASAGSPADFITALAEVGTAASATKTAVTQFADQLSGFAESGSEQLQQAFGEAPACQSS